MIERGQVHRAGPEVSRAARLLDQCDEMTPWLEAVSHVFVARALVRLGRPAEAKEAPGRRAGSDRSRGSAPAEAGGSRSATAGANQRKPDGVGSDLTPAELRLLGYLPTHLSLREIAEEFVVSTNTVKSQAQAVYRKLGVSSRAEAVNVARAAGPPATSSTPAASEGRSPQGSLVTAGGSQPLPSRIPGIWALVGCVEAHRQPERAPRPGRAASSWPARDRRAGCSARRGRGTHRG